MNTSADDDCENVHPNTTKRDRQSLGLAGNAKKVMRPNGTTPIKQYVLLLSI